jgi:Ni2+-binding GTPase involved in maturation of urease and hydrogenase
MKTRLIIAGGFLGAGKTTLLWEAARRLMKQGLRVGLITNDQAPELVDSKLLSLNNLPVAEVSGSCFCCNFDGFTDSIRYLQAETTADVIIAEPTGSCTDLSATIMQPLKQYRNRELNLAPLSVLADPARLDPILCGEDAGLHPDAAYIYRKQLEESDLILINKVDRMQAVRLEDLIRRTTEAFPSATAVRAVSAVSGAGIDEWLELVTSSHREAGGGHLVEVDYEVYANGEAVLGWLNGSVRLHGEVDTDWDDFVCLLLTNLAVCFDRDKLSVGHVKAIVENGRKYMVGNLTGNAVAPSVRGAAGSGNRVLLILNARVETSPELLDRIVRETLEGLCAEGGYTADILAWRYFRPGRPQPTHRFSEVVAVG